MFNKKCMYCGSSSVGPGCPYGPKGIHVHPSNSINCIYCGSTSVGPGCPYSPTNVHVRGIDYNVMIKEALLNGLTTGLLMHRLSQPYTDWAAFKNGIINEHGKIIKQPTTLEEKSSFTSADAYIIRLRNMLTETQIELLNNAIYLTEQKNNLNNAKDIENYYNKKLTIKEKIDNFTTELFNLMHEANISSVSMIEFEKMLIESIATKK